MAAREHLPRVIVTDSLTTLAEGSPLYPLWGAILFIASAAPAASSVAFVQPSEIGADFAGPAYRQTVNAGVTVTWEFLATVPIRYAAQYAFNAPTLNDSMGGDPADETYQIIAHTTNAFVFYEGNLRSGHSVDNLAPAAPLTLAAQRVGSDVLLTWQASGEDEPDFRDYAIYRATSPGVQPILIHYLISSGDLDYTDVTPPGGYLYYIVTANDVHGNQSAPSNEASVTIPTGVGGTPTLPRELTLLSNAPNPFHDRTVFEVGAPSALVASVDVYDVAGRRLRSASVPLRAGWQSLYFDGRDQSGRELPSGVYFYRLHAASKMLTRKVVIAH